MLSLATAASKSVFRPTCLPVRHRKHLWETSAIIGYIENLCPKGLTASKNAPDVGWQHRKIIPIWVDDIENVFWFGLTASKLGSDLGWLHRNWVLIWVDDIENVFWFGLTASKICSDLGWRHRNWILILVDCIENGFWFGLIASNPSPILIEMITSKNQFFWGWLHWWWGPLEKLDPTNPLCKCWGKTTKIGGTSGNPSIFHLAGSLLTGCGCPAKLL